MDISVSATKINVVPKGRPSPYFGPRKVASEYPQKKRMLHVMKSLHLLTSKEFRKATYARAPIGEKI